MKKNLLLIFSLLLMTLALPTFAQDRNNEEEVVHIDQMQRRAARPGQLIVKFHDRSDIRVDAQDNRRFSSPTRNTSINTVLAEYNVQSIEQLLPNFQMPAQTRSAKSFGGQDVEERDLSQLHLITLNVDDSRNEYELMEALKELDEVEFAEPNYICYALGTPVQEPISEMLRSEHNRRNSRDGGNSANSYTTNDPMYAMQWGIPACHIDQLLTAPKIHSNWRPIIAIIDTGVDPEHPDLQGNIWTNSSEDGGATRADDDGNGFVDDIHGWDFVNQTGEMHDFNSHGTHCAGIAAAVGNNGIGITGACPDAYIMPVTVMQSDGTGDIATIIQGINYAAQNGADIISMSIGTYAYSIALEQALGQAYQTAVLVAAAGNDGTGIDPRCAMPAAPMFPAAFTFVFGVQATSTGGIAPFSNYDCDGPSYSQYNEEQLYNYELSAPGANIMSTVPNGQYRSYNGTSMACPLVAGGIASLLQRRDYQTKEILFGDLINYTSEFMPVDFWAAYSADSVAPAMLQMVAIEINDTLNGDGSMYADAGEHLQLYPTIRTMWGPADSVQIWLEFQEFEDTTTLSIEQKYTTLGTPLSSYAKAKSFNPIEVVVDSGVVDGRHISLTLCAAAPNAPDTLRHNFVLEVTNGVKLHGVLVGNHTLYPNEQYIVTGNLGMQAGDTLFIKPGTTLKIKDECTINATIFAIGKPDSMITFTKTDLGYGWESLISYGGVFDYCQFEYGTRIYGLDNHLWSNNLEGVSKLYIRNSIIKNFIDDTSVKGVHAVQSTFTNLKISNGFSNSSEANNVFHYCNISNNRPYNIFYIRAEKDLYYGGSQDKRRYLGNNIYGNEGYDFKTEGTQLVVLTLDTNYYGSLNENVIRQHIYDFYTPTSSTGVFLDLSKRASRPSALAHGIVWKVEVNGYDAQDEFDSIIPLGVGTHEFKVYFNRAMDTSVTPMLAMGVRPPYTQTAIGENSSWSADSTIYTAHVTLTGRSAIDGLNRIYVANAQDNEHFEIPFENQRFNVNIASSGSMSAGFQATAGIGKVDLEWNDQEVNYEDFLGFNMYRYQYDSLLTNRHYVSGVGYVYDTIWGPTDTIRLNTTLIQDTLFTDFNVVPGERYYYFYKILSTSLTENSPSRIVSCVPNSSIPGDANGSYAVDIADVITTINYVTGQNPQPFLFDATDVNGDGQINVLDIVGIINIILHPDSYNSKAEFDQQTAIYTIEDGILYVNTPVALGGLQFNIANCNFADIEILEAMQGFEIVNTQNPDGSLMLLAYSMSGVEVPAGKTALLRIGNKEIENIVLSDTEGHNVIAINGDALGMTDIENLPAQIQKAFPNPFEREVQIEFVIGKENCHKAQLHFTDMMGRTVEVVGVSLSNTGKYIYKWNAANRPAGIYFATLSVDGIKAHTIKLILK